MTERKGSTVNENLQAQHCRTAAAQLKLELRRLRAGTPNWHQKQSLDQLLDSVDSIAFSLEGLKSTGSEAATVSAGVNAEAIQ
jgi:hypothetical protein